MADFIKLSGYENTQYINIDTITHIEGNFVYVIGKAEEIFANNEDIIKIRDYIMRRNKHE